MLSWKDLLDPCAWVWFAVMVAAAWHWRKGQKRWALVLAAAAISISVCTIIAVPLRLLEAKEDRYWTAMESPDFERSLSGVQAVVMCGGVLEPSANDFTGANYGDTVDRFLKAVEMARKLSVPLVLGGGEAGGKGSPFESVFEIEWLKNWGVTNLTVLDLGACQTTHDEALAAARLAKVKNWNKIILVTSGYHMDRALGAFRKTGLNVTPVACDFRAIRSSWNKTSRRFLPDADTAATLRLFLCEEVGSLYYRCRGWL